MLALARTAFVHGFTNRVGNADRNHRLRCISTLDSKHVVNTNFESQKAKSYPRNRARIVTSIRRERPRGNPVIRLRNYKILWSRSVSSWASCELRLSTRLVCLVPTSRRVPHGCGASGGEWKDWAGVNCEEKTDQCRADRRAERSYQPM